MKGSARENGAQRPKRRIAHRTAQLRFASRLLYRIEHYSSLPAVALSITALVLVFDALGYPNRWAASFEVAACAITLVMVFSIQHSQGREQAATQRNLSELIRALPRRTSI